MTRQAAWERIVGAQGELFGSGEAPHVHRRVRCWLLAPRGGHTARLEELLREVPSIVCDPATGSVVIGEHDLVAVMDRARGEAVCLGSEVTASLLGASIRRRGFGAWPRPSGGLNRSTFRPMAQRAACIGVAASQPPGAFRQRPDGNAYTEVSEILRDAGLEELQDAMPPAEAAILRGHVHFACGQAFHEAGHASADSPALAHFRLAEGMLWPRAASLAADASARVGAILGVPGAPAHATRRLGAASGAAGQWPSLEAKILDVIAIRLPHLAPRLPPSAPGESTGLRRIRLCSVPGRRAALKALLPPDPAPALSASVTFGSGTAPSEPEGVVRLGLGETLRATAMLDAELNQILGVRGEAGREPVTVFADAGGVLLKPESRQGVLGRPVTFEVVGSEEGVHNIRFTFLTRDRFVSRLQRRIEVS